MVLRYQRGLFLPEAGVYGLDKMVKEQKADEVFLALLTRFTEAGRNVSEKPSSNRNSPPCSVRQGAGGQRFP